MSNEKEKYEEGAERSTIVNLFAQDHDNVEMDFEGCDNVELGRRFLLECEKSAMQKYLEYLGEKLLIGNGETIIEIGVPIDSSRDEPGLSAEELEKSLQNHNSFISNINCSAMDLINRNQKGDNSRVVLLRRIVDETDFIEVRIAVVGNVDAGKSTLLGVLTHNILDDGRGIARKKLFRHKHEFESGRTSSVGNDILGFSSTGEITNKPDAHSGHLNWVDICRESAKVITFIDLAGHEKYLKTTIFGLTGHVPDYTMLMVGANAGIIGTAKEHLQLALSLGVPVMVVVTKIDMCPPNVLSETMICLDKILKSSGVRKLSILVNDMEDIVRAAENFHGGKVCPIFQVSNVVGTNLGLLRKFLNLVPVSRPNLENEPAQFFIDDIYLVDGVGTVVSGTCLSGKISLNDNLLLGPDFAGKFNSVPIKSIHRKRMPVSCVKYGQTASFALRKFQKKDVRKGMAILSPLLNPMSAWEFEAEVLVLHHPTTICLNYQAVVHVGSIRQTATIVKMNKDVLRTGDRDFIHLRFIRRPEYLRLGTRIVFREGRTKAVGSIRQIFFCAESPQGQNPAKCRNKKQGKFNPPKAIIQKVITKAKPASSKSIKH